MPSQKQAGSGSAMRGWRGGLVVILTAVVGLSGPVVRAQSQSVDSGPPPYALECTAPIHFENIPALHVVVPAQDVHGSRFAQGNCQDAVAGHSTGDFEGPADFSIVTCLAEGEFAAASFGVDEGFFPIEVTRVEMVFASTSEEPTTTAWTMEVWSGVPGTALEGFVVSNAQTHVQLDPDSGITAMNVVVDLSANPIVVEHHADEPDTFSVGFRVDQHNDQDGSGCSCLDIPPASNAFPTVDTDGVDQPADNWYFEDPGCQFACNAGWIRFQDMGIDCVPSGDWVLRATWRPVNCPDFGACCFDDGTCQNLFNIDCAAAAGTFQGAGSMCNDGVVDCVPKGGCCVPFGGDVFCFDNQTEADCIGLGGTWPGPGLACDQDGDGLDDLCDPVLGACCLPDGGCSALSEDDCTASGGEYHGDDVPCSAVTCLGACCAGAQCLEDTELDGCPFNWYGPTSSCNDQPSPCSAPLPPGACCKFDGSDCQILERSACSEEGDSWLGPNSTCDNVTCADLEPLGACCGTGPQGCGCVANQTPSQCAELDGSWAGENSTCADDCSTCQACCKCQESGVVTCTDVQADVCLLFDGTPLGQGTSCATSSCAAPIGACCGPGKGVCANLTQFQCAGLGGAWQGCNGACGDDPSPCIDCTSAADCDDMIACTVDSCVSENCQNTPNDSLCNDGNPCTTDTCDPSGGCVHQPILCDDGFFCNGIETCSGGACQPGVAPCPPEQCDENTDMCSGPVEGACCVDGVGCVPNQTSTECFDLGGLFQGVGVSCTPDPCLGTGACCVSGVGCIANQTAGECGDLGGVYQGDGTACGPDTCPTTGACCVSGIGCIANQSTSECDGFGGVYQGDGSACTPNPCASTGACCVSGIGCISNQSATECGDFGGVYQGDGSMCTPETCASTGACCTGIGCIGNQSSSECDGFGGVYQGDGSACTPNPCPTTGACCTQIGCIGNQTTAECSDVGGSYQGNGSMCSPDPCGDPVGACCDGATCSEQTEADCMTAGGVYQGDESVCMPNPCAPCTKNGDCEDGDACTDDTCDATSTCNHAPVDCDDGDPCTDDPCDPLSGCQNMPVDCDDADPCTTDGCDPATGCVHEADACDDGDVCTTDSCDPSTGACMHEAIDCDDGDPCTSEVCDAIVGCVFTPACDDGDACTEDSCDAVDGCDHQPVVCDDGFFCNGEETCDPDDGCQAGTPLCPPEVCNEAMDDCVTPPLSGACCDCLATCTEGTEAQCLIEANSGTYQGDGSACAETMCSCQPHPTQPGVLDPNLNCSADGCVNAADLAVVLGAWGNPGCGGEVPCCRDLNMDGAVNAADLAIVLGAWGCPTE